MSSDAQKKTTKKATPKAKNTYTSQPKNIVKQCPDKKQSASNATKPNTSNVAKIDTLSATNLSTLHATNISDAVKTDTPDIVQANTSYIVKESTSAHNAEASIQSDFACKEAQKEYSNQKAITLYRALQDCRVGGLFRRKGEIVSLPVMDTPFSFLEHIPDSERDFYKTQKKASIDTMGIQVSKKDMGIGEPTLVCDVTSSDMINQ